MMRCCARCCTFGVRHGVMMACDSTYCAMDSPACPTDSTVDCFSPTSCTRGRFFRSRHREIEMRGRWKWVLEMMDCEKRDENISGMCLRHSPTWPWPWLLVRSFRRFDLYLQ